MNWRWFSEETARIELTRHLLRQECTTRRWANHRLNFLRFVPCSDFLAELFRDTRPFQQAKLFPVLVAVLSRTEHKVPVGDDSQPLKKLK